MSSLESVDLSIESINKEELYSIENNNIQGLSNSQNLICLYHAFNLTSDTISQVLREGSRTSMSGASESNAPAACSSPAASAPQAAAINNKPLTSSSADIVPDDYFTAEKELESLLSIQAGNWNQFNENSQYLLTYMIGFAEKFPDSPVVASPAYLNVEAALVENYISTVFVNSGGDEQKTNEAIAAIYNLYSGNVPPQIQSLLDYNYYVNKYESDGQVISQKTLHEYQINNLFYTGINSLFSLIYKDEINQIMANLDSATFLDGDFQIYLQLSLIFAQKSDDSLNEVAGCANMLMELSTGSTAVGDAETELSNIVSYAANSSTLSEINEGLNATAEELIHGMEIYNPTQEEWDDFAKQYGISDEARDAIADLYTTLTPLYENSDQNIDFSKLDTDTQSQIVNDFNTINNDPAAVSFMVNYCNLYVPGMVEDLSEFQGQYPYDDAQKLAENLLFIRDMGQNYNDTIFPDLLKITSQFLGDDSNPDEGDFFDIVGITLDQLKGAAQGNEEDEEALINGILNVVPVNADGTTSGLSTINNELNAIANYFSGDMQQEQANMEYICAITNQLLSFLQEIYQAPLTLTSGIQTNLNQSDQ